MNRLQCHPNHRRAVKVLCECGESYPVRSVPTMGLQARIINYSLCPYCGQPRNYKYRSWIQQQIRVGKICKYFDDCLSISTKAFGVCQMHYMREYREATIQVTKVKKVYFGIHGKQESRRQTH